MNVSTKTQPFSSSQSELDIQRFALECSGNFIWIWDLASGVINILGDTQQIFNYKITNNQVSVDFWFANIHEDDRAGANDKIRQLIKGKVSHYNHSYRLKHGDGTWVWLNANARVYEHHPDGKVKTLVGYDNIIDQQKHLEHEQNEHISQLSFAMLSTRSSLFDFDIINQNFKQLNFEQTKGGTSTIDRKATLKEGLSTVHPGERQTNLDFFNSFSDGSGELKEAMWRSNYRSDEYRWQKAQGRVVSFDDKGKPLRAVGIRQDIHDAYTIELQANKAQERDSQALGNTFHGVWEWHLKTGYFFVPDNIVKGLLNDTSRWQKNIDFWWEFVHPDDKQRTSATISRQIKKGENLLHTEYRIKSNKGEWVWLASKGKIVERDENGQPIRAIGTVIDISDQKAIEIALEHEKEVAQTTLESINEAVITTDKMGIINSINHKAQQLLSTNEKKAVGHNFESLCTLKEENSSILTHNPIQLCIDSDLAFNLTKLMLTNQSAKTFHIDCSVSPLHDPAHQLIGCVMVIRDVTRTRKITQEIEHRAQHDPLTGIYNRHAFEAALERNTQTDEFEHILCYIDLDQFKIVNDTCGHMAGDELLRQLSTELSKKIRKSDIFARLGGDEFGILMLNCDIKHALKISKSIKNIVSDYTFHWEDKAFKLGASIGLARINPTTSASAAMRHADTACFSAKEQGRDRIHVYRPDDGTMTSTQGQIRWVPRLQEAIKENHFILYVQAIIDLQNPTSTPSHFEVLIRLNDDSKIIPPGAFLPAAERYNLANQIDKWVIEHTFFTLSTHIDKIRSNDIFNINLSAASLCEPNFLKFVKASFKNSIIEPYQICFEITETAAVTNLTAANTIIIELRAMGCQFALDDFGSGLSSFGYLKNFSVDYLKIDGSFVKDLMTDPIDAAMVKSINEIGQIMGKQTVAEFVENQDIADKLTDMGVNYAQGYHFSVPAPLIDLLTERSTNQTSE